MIAVLSVGTAPIRLAIMLPMKTKNVSPMTSSAAATNPTGTEFTLRAAIVETCQHLHDEQLDALGLLSLSHRSARSAAPGMLSLGRPGALPSHGDGLQWHALTPERLGWATDGGDGQPPPGIGSASTMPAAGSDQANDAKAATDADNTGDPWLALHRALLSELAQVNCVLLLAPVHATALACMATIQRDGLPPFHPALTTFGGDDLACADCLPTTATTGQTHADVTALAIDNVLSTLGARHACLLANLGMLVTGQSLRQAAERARRLAALARTYCTALQCGEPALLEAGRMHDTRHHWQVPR